MSGIEVYDALSKPPAEALKRINGGRMNGKTDINPQWRYRAMTEQFGLCGIGWKFTIDRQWTEQGDHGEVMAFVNVSLYVKQGDTWSEAIQGSGGNMLIEAESKGLHNSDEAFKMATTDALSVAMKYLGVASAIYAGQWDGSKYNDEPRKAAVNVHETPPAAPEPNPVHGAIKAEIAAFVAVMQNPIFTDDDRAKAKAKIKIGEGQTEAYLAYVRSIVDEYRSKIAPAPRAEKPVGERVSEMFKGLPVPKKEPTAVEQEIF